MRNQRQFIKDNGHHFFQNFSNRNEIAHQLTQRDLLCLHSTECHLSLHLGSPPARNATVSDHVSGGRLDANRILLACLQQKYTAEVGVNETINPQIVSRLENQTICFGFSK